MALSAKQRMQRHRLKLKQLERVALRAMLPAPVHARLKRQAARKGATLHEHAVKILTRASKA